MTTCLVVFFCLAYPFPLIPMVIGYYTLGGFGLLIGTVIGLFMLSGYTEDMKSKKI